MVPSDLLPFLHANQEQAAISVTVNKIMDLSFRKSSFGEIWIQFSSLYTHLPLLCSVQKGTKTQETIKTLINWSRCKISFGVLWSFVAFRSINERENVPLYTDTEQTLLALVVIYRSKFEEYFLFTSLFIPLKQTFQQFAFLFFRLDCGLYNLHIRKWGVLCHSTFSRYGISVKYVSENDSTKIFANIPLVFFQK